MLSTAWFACVVLFFLIALEFIRGGGLPGMLMGVVFFLLSGLCLVGFNWSLRGFRLDHTIMPDGEKIDHGK